MEKEWIEFKNKIINNFKFIDDIPLFSFIEFNLSNRCTRNCSFCPTSNSGKPEYLDLSLYNKFLLDCKDLNFEGLIAYSGFSEALLHSHLSDLIYKTKEILPNSKLVVSTNGDLLSKDLLQNFFNLGLDILSISLYDGSYQIDHFSKMIYDAQLSDRDIFFRKRYLGEKKVILCNRGGAIKTHKKLPIDEVCHYPFYMIYIDYNGDLLFCSHDYNKNLVIGNIRESKLLDLWKSEKLNFVRKQLREKTRDFAPCSNCDVLGNLMGEKNFRAFK